jgi:hypothetical protein
LRELPSYESRLPEIAAGLKDAELGDFSRQVFFEESYAQFGLKVADWDRVLQTLRAEVERRSALMDLAVELAWLHASSKIARNRWQEGEDLLRQASNRARPGNDILGWIHASWAQSLAAQERWTSALKHLELAETERGTARNTEAFKPWIEGIRGRMWLTMGMPGLAEEWVTSQWEEGSRSQDANERWAAFDVRSDFLLASNDYAALRALEREVRASAWFAGLSAADVARVDLRFTLGRVEEGLHSPNSNLRAREQLASLLDGRLQADVDRAAALYFLTLANLDAGELTAAADSAARLRTNLAAARTLDPSRPEHTLAPRLLALEACLAAERARRGLIGVEDLRTPLEGARQTWSAVRARWSELPTYNGGIGYLLHSNRQLLVEALLDLEMQVGGPELGASALFEWLIDAQLRSTLARRMGLQAGSLERVRERLLAPSRGLIAWIPLRSKSFAVAIDDRRARAFVLPGVDRLEERAGELIGRVQAAIESGEEGARSSLAALFGASKELFLPRELEAFADAWDSIYLAGLDDIGFVPLELFETAAGGTLGSRRALCRVPSIPVAAALAGRVERAPTADRSGVLIVADELLGSAAREYQVQPLKLEAPLEREFRRSLGGVPAQVLKGRAANFDALRELSARPCGFLHVFSHGIRREHERPAGFLIAPCAGNDGAVFAEEIEALRSPALVCLSVCGATRTGLRRGDGGRGDLASAFFLAGAAAIASSPANLEVAPTMRTGAAVHAALADGAPLAEALRLARQSAVERGGIWGSESLNAHLLQVSGAGLTARLAAPEDGLVAPERPPHRRWIAAALTAGVAFAAWAASRLIRGRTRGKAQD